MAPADVSEYLPPLDLCLKGDKQLLSWRLAFVGVADETGTVGYNALQRFFAHDETIKVLTDLIEPQPSSTRSTRDEFDTYTSAINIPPNGNGEYDLQKIKDDAIWLGSVAKIDEISALRIIVVELQSRSRSRLFHEGEQEVAPKLSGSTRLKSSLLLSKIRSSSKSISDLEDFHSTPARRFRILNIFLSERRFQFKVLSHILFRTLLERQIQSHGRSGIHEEDSGQTRVLATQAGNEILAAWNVNKPGRKQRRHWLVDTVSVIREKLDSIATGSRIDVDEKIQEELEIQSCETAATCIVHLMHTVQVIAQSTGEILTAESVTHWFGLMEQVGFFANVELPFEGLNERYMYDIRCFATVTTLAILNVPKALKTVPALSTGAQTDTDPSATVYLQDVSCIEHITLTLLNSAGNRVVGAQPLSLAWSIILQDARGYADTSQVVRENRLAQRAIDSIGASALSDSESVDGSSERRRPSPNRRTSFGSDSSQQLTYLEEVVDVLQKIEPTDDVINLLARSAFQDAGAFEVISELALRFCREFGSERNGLFGSQIRSLFLDLIEVSLNHIDYQPELISTILAILTGGESYWSIVSKTLHSAADSNIVYQFLQSSSLRARLFDTALARFPYESLPFLKLCQALSVAPLLANQFTLPLKSFLDSISSLTSIFYEEDTSYELKGEGDNMYIVLQSPLNVLATGQDKKQKTLQQLITSSPSSESGSPEDMILPIGTSGRTLTESKPLVVMFRHAYSGLRYLGLVLRQALDARFSSHVDLSESISEIATETVGLLSRMLVTACQSAQNGKSFEEAQSIARGILEEASAGLGRNQDIVSVILEMFEDELYDQKAGSHTALPTDLLVHCMEFLHSLLLVLPGRVWPFLGRSGLLGIKGTESRLINVVATLEVPTGQYNFLLSATYLLDALVDDIVTHAISRKAGNGNSSRFVNSAPESSGSGITESLMKKIILNYEKILIDVFESTGNWRFLESSQRFEINSNICRTFEKILSCCYESDDEPDLSKKLMSALGPSAEYLLDVFLSPSSNDLPTQPLTEAIQEGVNSPSDVAQNRIDRGRVRLATAALRFTNVLVRANTYLNRPISKLQLELFSYTPALTKLYALLEEYRVPVIELLDSLVRGWSKSSEQPSSLLGHIGQQAAKSFVDLLSKLDGPLDNKYLPPRIWRLLSGIVSERQQWFAMYILTGNTPKESLKIKADASSKRPRYHPIFDVAMHQIRKMTSNNLMEIIPILEFLSSAADFWPNVCEEIRKDNTLLTSLLNYISKLGDVDQDRLINQSDLQPQRIQVAALVINILAILTHRGNEVHDSSFANQTLPHLKHLIEQGAATPEYNASLHSRLRQNFESKYPGCKLSNFKKTSLYPSELGPAFYYDLEIAQRALQHDKAWTSSKGRDFRGEFIVANRNLSMVEAQMNLFHSWKSLIVELSIGLEMKDSFQGSVTTVIRSCLAANVKTTLPELVFSRLMQARASLAFTLMQRLVESARTSPDARSILRPAWEAFRDNTSELGVGLSGNDADYVRTLMKILYLSLQPHLAGSENNVDTSLKQQSTDVTTVLEILRLGVANGFRSLVTALHENASTVLPSDFSLVNGLLRTCLRIPNVDRQTEQLLAIFADENTAFHANTLLSWAHQLTIDQDPVYGEIGLSFILELSTVPVLAEYVVTAHALSQIGTATLMNYWRRPGGTGQFDQPTRMYTIWTRALLPLAINLLTAIGAPIASDIGAFVNQFGPQLDRASTLLRNKTSAPRGRETRPSCVTLAMASEVHSLALIGSVLKMFKMAGASAGITPTEVPDLNWDPSIVRSDLETRLQRRITLREDIVPTDEREEALSKQKPADVKSPFDNRLEEKVVGELTAALALLGDTDT